MIYFRLHVDVDKTGSNYISVRGETFMECVEKISTIMNHHFIPYKFYLFYMCENDSARFGLSVKSFSAEDFSKFVIKTGVGDLLIKERLY